MTSSSTIRMALPRVFSASPADSEMAASSSVFTASAVTGQQGMSYVGQIDAFGVYCRETRDSYIVPMDAIANCGAIASLRVSATKNGQAKRIRLASEFLIEREP